VFGVKLSDEHMVDFKVLRDVAMATIFGFAVSHIETHYYA